MESTLLAISAIFMVGALYVLLPVAAEMYAALRGARTVRCADGGVQTEIGLDARRAAIQALFGVPRLEVARCGRWPERRDCARGCLHEVDLITATKATSLVPAVRDRGEL